MRDAVEANAPVKGHLIGRLLCRLFGHKAVTTTYDIDWYPRTWDQKTGCQRCPAILKHS